MTEEENTQKESESLKENLEKAQDLLNLSMPGYFNQQLLAWISQIVNSLNQLKEELQKQSDESRKVLEQGLKDLKEALSEVEESEEDL